MRWPNEKQRGWRTMLWLSSGLLVWLVVLPWLARTGGFAERLRELADRGVDPSALFYTDHPAFAAGALPGADTQPTETP
ncbi:hypothetical protein [Botrimarina hoheduenensis]|uniref:Uncharacterized protein n=1 Tax=Botrimarina hoheduenensis TaxID=2528000 RepID=A0A5C5W6T9_9BACT|nr:hypothetical protein [Botrimarina hoheduenensis]TWT46400.1 hypothetical protein Pla111_14960 [Botrimarina hoheduenensis]